MKTKGIQLILSMFGEVQSHSLSLVRLPLRAFSQKVLMILYQIKVLKSRKDLQKRLTRSIYHEVSRILLPSCPCPCLSLQPFFLGDPCLQ